MTSTPKKRDVGFPRGRNKRTPDEREHDLVIIADKRLEGLTMLEIAGILNASRPYTLSRSMIREDIYEIERRWLEASIEATSLRKARELVRLNKLEAKFMACYERSIQKKKRLVKEQLGKPGAKGETIVRSVRVTQTEEEADGDPRFLQGVIQCIQERCRIFGVYEAAKLEHAGPGGAPIEVESTSQVRFYLPSNGREIGMADLVKASQESGNAKAAVRKQSGPNTVVRRPSGPGRPG